MIDLGHVARLVVEGHGAAPCAVAAAAAWDGGWRFGIGAAGRLSADPAAPAATPETLFDLASVTKPFVALALARLGKRGVLARTAALGDVLTAVAGTASADVPLDLFAAHRAGLEAHLPLWTPLERGEPFDAIAAMRTAADARRADCPGDPPPEGFPPVYSDNGYLLLGAAIAARAGRELEEVVRDEVIAPLGLGAGSARQLAARLGDAAFLARVAPTEVVAWRGGELRGVVHDENAFALAGRGLAGHAGLFGAAADVTRFGAAVVDALAGRSGWLAPDDLAPVLRPRPGGSHRAGFDSKSGDAPSAGARFGAATFGHLGFTGTSLWIDPDAALVGVLLTNRVHPTRDHIAIRAARPPAYDAMFEAMLG